MPQEKHPGEWKPQGIPPLTAREIGELFGINESRVNQIIRRAIHRLRELVSHGGAMGRDVKFFCECKRCGERWLIGTGLLDVAALGKSTECPNCWACAKEIRLCPTHGEDAVTEPRKGGPEFANKTGGR